MSYKKINYGKKSVRRNYSGMLYDVQLPNLLDIQKKNFDHFIKYDIKKLFNDISPIVSKNEMRKIYLEDPFFEPENNTSALPGYVKAKIDSTNYERKLKCKIRYQNLSNGVELVEGFGKNQDDSSTVDVCDFPFMTPSGTFVINGAERVIISKISRSPGVYFANDENSKIKAYTAKIIPTFGVWIELEKDGTGTLIKSKLDKNRGFNVSVLMRALGLEDGDALNGVKFLFGQNIDKIIGPFNKDAKKREEALAQIYNKLKGGETAYGNAAESKAYLRDKLFDSKRYDLEDVGRIKLNLKLDVFERALNKTLAVDILDKDGNVFLPKNTRLDLEKVELLKQNRHLIRKEIMSKYENLEFESFDEVFVVPEYDENGKVTHIVCLKDIVNNQTGEILIKKDKVVTEQDLIDIRNNKDFIPEKVAKFFINEYIERLNSEKSGLSCLIEREQTRIGVIVEMLEVYSDESNNIPFKLVGNNSSELRKYVTISDIIATMSYYFNLCGEVGIGTLDDIDNLRNRRVSPINEILSELVRKALVNVKRTAYEKLNTPENNRNADGGRGELNEVKSGLNFMTLQSMLRSFFGTSQYSQFMDQVNPLSELTQKRRVSAVGSGGLTRERAGVDVRDVHNSHYGRICPIETPEGQSIGLISSLSCYATLDDHGFIQTPFLKVIHNGEQTKVINEMIYLTVSEEDNKVIASASTKVDNDGVFVEETIIGRLNGETSYFPKSEVSYMDVSPKQIVSVAATTIPFLEHDAAVRGLMGANMQRQALPLLSPQSPIVGTGTEHKVAKDSGTVVLAKVDGYVKYADAKLIYIIPAEKSESYEDVLNDTTREAVKHELLTLIRTNNNTTIVQRPIVKTGEYVEKDDIIADGPSTKDGELALGKNVTVAFTTFEGYNYEDAIIICEDLVKQDAYTSIHIEEYSVEAKRLRGFGSGKGSESRSEVITRDVEQVNARYLTYLDANGIVLVGTEVGEGDILVGRNTPKSKNEPTGYELLAMELTGSKGQDQKNASLKVPHGGGGTVIDWTHYKKPSVERKKEAKEQWENLENKSDFETVEEFITNCKTIINKSSTAYSFGDKRNLLNDGTTDKVIVHVAKKRKIIEGDKMAGRHGNKGVISKILPREDMPYLADGTQVDILLSPLGVPSRMNIGQVLEIHLGLAAKRLGEKIATPVFDGVQTDDLAKIMEEAGINPTGKFTLYDGRTGLPFARDISVGVMYMIKLNHMVDEKLHARSTANYTIVSQQPMGGKAQNGGQRFGEMEVWALYAYGASNVLQEILTIKSDDMMGRQKALKAIKDSQPLGQPGLPESFRVLVKELQSLCLYVELIDSKTTQNVLLQSYAKQISKGGRNV